MIIKKNINNRINELKMIKYHTEIVENLVDHNVNREKNVKDEDKLIFPFVVVEFPNKKKSDVKK